MGSLPTVRGSRRASGASRTFSTVARRLVSLLSMLLLGESLVECDGMASHTQVLIETSSYPQCAGLTAHIRDGHCNEANNNADCGFDGGDCCASTCIAGLAHACGGRHQKGGFDCRNPHALITPRHRLSGESCGGFPDSIGDTKCDSANNNFECSYDGGDCCECTCSPDLLAALVEEAYLTKSDVTECLDCFHPTCYALGGISVPSSTPAPIYHTPVPSPTASTVPSPTDIPVAHPTSSPVASPDVSPGPSPTLVPESSPAVTTSECGGSDSYIGNGGCNHDTNTLECNWDGGDCCECTCQATDEYQCPEFDCLDPHAATDCESPSSVSTSSFSTVSPVPSPVYASPAPSAKGTPGQTSPGVISPVSPPTERPVQAPAETPEDSGSSDTESEGGVTGSGSASAEGGRSSQSDSFTESGRSTGEGTGSLTASGRSDGDSDSSTDGDSSTYGGGLEEDEQPEEEEEEEEEEEKEEAVSTSSTTLAASTGTFVVFHGELVAVLCASVLGYYMA